MKLDKKTWIIIGVSAVVVGGSIAIYFYATQKKNKSDKYGNPFLKDKDSGGITGGIRSKTGGVGQTITEPDWNRPFDMTYEDDVREWVYPRTVKTLDTKDAKDFARKLSEAKGGWFRDDDEDAVKGVFKQLEDKVQVARLSRVFWDDHKKDMWEHLRSFLSNSEMETYVHKPVRLLPNYHLA